MVSHTDNLPEPCLLVSLIAKARRGFFARGPGVLLIDAEHPSGPVQSSVYLPLRAVSFEDAHPAWRALLAQTDQARETIVHVLWRSLNVARTYRVDVSGLQAGILN